MAYGRKTVGSQLDKLLAGDDHLSTALRQSGHNALDYGHDRVKKGVESRLGLEGNGFFSNLVRRAAHGGIDIIGDTIGGNLPKKAYRKRPVSMMGPNGEGFLSDALSSVGFGAQPKRKGKGFLSNLVRRAAHGGVDIIGDTLGGNIRPNPLANANEGLAAALRQKKVGFGGEGLYVPGRH